MLADRVKIEMAKKKNRSFCMPTAVIEPAKIKSNIVCRWSEYKESPYKFAWSILVASNTNWIIKQILRVA